MVQVSLTGSFRAAMGGAASVEVEADTIRELFARLLERYPALQDHLDEGIAVSMVKSIGTSGVRPYPPMPRCFCCRVFRVADGFARAVWALLLPVFSASKRRWAWRADQS